MAKVEYNSENCMQCMCPSCPVQVMSNCTLNKREKWLEMQKEMNAMMMKEMPGMASSMGVRGGMSGMSMPMESMPMGKEKEEKGMEMEMLQPQEMIGLYCSSEIGKSSCSDLDTTQSCSCPSCMVWMRHNLTQYKYCTEGDADQRG